MKASELFLSCTRDGGFLRGSVLQKLVMSDTSQSELGDDTPKGT